MFGFPFELDDFQKEACDTIDRGESVVVCAPTGAGKTKVAEYLAARFMNEIYKGTRRTSVCGVACHRLILANNLLERILYTLAEKIGLNNIDLVIVNSGNYDKFIKKFNSFIDLGPYGGGDYREIINETIRDKSIADDFLIKLQGTAMGIDFALKELNLGKEKSSC